MKKVIITVVIAVSTLSACSDNEKSTKSEDSSKQVMTNSGVTAQSSKPQVGNSAPNSKDASPAREIIANYITLKNALAKDNSKDAATAGKSIASSVSNFDMNNVSASQMKNYMDLADDMKEHASHIGDNAGNIAHQREHFIMISEDVTELVKMFGNGGDVLYQDFCPMANNGKGATWLSEVKEISNPYLGKKMPDCGSVKATLK